MSFSSEFKLQPADLVQLAPYLQHDPNNIYSGIPDPISRECSEILDLMNDIKNHVIHGHLDQVYAVFVERVFGKALEMIFDRPFIVSDQAVIASGVKALWDAKCDLTERDMEGISDEARLELPDWDSGMVACAIIKACGRKASELVPAD